MRLDFKGQQLRVAEINGKKYVVGEDLGQLFGYSRAREALSQHCGEECIKETVKFAGDVRGIKRILASPEGVEKLLERTTKELDDDRLSFLHNILIPFLRSDDEDLDTKDNKIRCLETKIDKLQDELSNLRKTLKTTEIDKKRYKMDWEDTEAYLENAERDLDEMERQLKFSTKHNEMLQIALRAKDECILCRLKNRLRRA